MVDRRRAKTALIAGIAGNVSLLGIYKYTDFVTGNLNQFFQLELPVLGLMLPLAISFFTFQQIAYLVDSYRSETPAYDFIHYAVFVSFFPQLIAGPIVHHSEMMPQFADPENRRINLHHIASGIFIFAIGLFKKVAVADTFAVWANSGFEQTAALSFIEAWRTSLSYTFQLYFDFSGYTDMAIGAALLFNIRLPINFNSPYKSRNIQDFWQRWHITLSRFLREYIYIPLGGNWRGQWRTYRNLLIVFLVGGLWHGAGWTFVFWGGLHGAAMIVHRWWVRTRIRLPAAAAWLLTFNFVNAAWVFFRAGSWQDAFNVLRAMMGLAGFSSAGQAMGTGEIAMVVQGSLSGLLDGAMAPVWLGAAFVVVLAGRNSVEMRERFRPAWGQAALTAMFLSGGVLGLMRVSEFLYFNF